LKYHSYSVKIERELWRKFRLKCAENAFHESIAIRALIMLFVEGKIPPSEIERVYHKANYYRSRKKRKKPAVEAEGLPSFLVDNPWLEVLREKR